MTCYDPNGNALTGNYPCDFPNLSTCCGYGWDCLTNGLCRQHGTTGYAQSTCTDPTYKDCLSFCNQSQFDGFGEVSRCGLNGNSWCCAGAAGQGLGGPNCCDTNRTTSLEPYPFSAVDNTGQSVVASSSISPSITLTNHISSLTVLKSIPTRFSSLGTSLQSTSQISAPTLTQFLATPSQTSPSPQPTEPSNNSKSGIEIGLPVAIVVVLLAVIAFFAIQNRRFKRRLIQLHERREEASLRPEETRPKMQDCEGNPVAELDLTHYELTQRDAPKHELLGNQIHEINHIGFPQHELVGDGPRS